MVVRFNNQQGNVTVTWPNGGKITVIEAEARPLDSEYFGELAAIQKSQDINSPVFDFVNAVTSQYEGEGNFLLQYKPGQVEAKGAFGFDELVNLSPLAGIYFSEALDSNRSFTFNPQNQRVGILDSEDSSTQNIQNHDEWPILDPDVSHRDSDLPNSEYVEAEIEGFGVEKVNSDYVPIIGLSTSDSNLSVPSMALSSPGMSPDLLEREFMNARFEAIEEGDYNPGFWADQVSGSIMELDGPREVGDIVSASLELLENDNKVFLYQDSGGLQAMVQVGDEYVETHPSIGYSAAIRLGDDIMVDDGLEQTLFQDEEYPTPRDLESNSERMYQ